MRLVALVDRSWYGVLPAGGAETMIHSLVSFLVTKGWEAQAIIWNGSPTVQVIDGIEVTITEDKHRVHEIVSQADLIITHLGATPRARTTGRAYDIPVVQLIHNTNQYSIGFLGDGCDLAIYNSNWVREFHHEQKNSKIIHSWQNNGHAIVRARRCFDWPDIVVRPPADEEPQSFGNPSGYITLVNLVPNKGPDVFYDLAAKNPDLKFRGVIGGYEPEKQDIRSLPNVEIFEHTPDVNDFYSEASIVLIPSKYESYGRVAVEAMARQIPVLATETPGLKESIGHGGVLVSDRENIWSWNYQIKSILSEYEHFQVCAKQRYAELQKQTELDLLNLDATLRKM